MIKNFKQAFTMVELIFVIIIIAILSAVAIPRLSATRDDAEITKARTMVASVRNALAMERQKRILKGDFSSIDAVGGPNTGVFGNFDDNTSKPMVLEYSEPSGTGEGDWEFVSPNIYRFHSSALGGTVDFKVINGKFVCNESLRGCQQLVR